MRPRGTPPTAIGASSDKEVVDIAGTSETSRSPRRIIDPLPNLFSMLSSAASMARLRSAIRSSGITGISFFCSSFVLVVSRGIPRLIGSEHNTTQARMEQNFIHETSHFRRVWNQQPFDLAPRQPSLRYPKVRRCRQSRLVKLTRQNTPRI